jgi:excisionase family DNA binding protein
MNQITIESPALMTKSQIAEQLQVSTRQFENWVAAGKAPKPIRIGYHPRWRRSEIMAWIAAGCPAVGTQAQADETDSPSSQADDSADAAN